MNTPHDPSRLVEITAALKAVILRLENKLIASTDNKGMQYKINNRTNWECTIGLRCNHVFIESVAGYVACVNTELSLHQILPILEYVSISKAYDTDPTTLRKRLVPWKRTMFITFRPPREVFDKLKLKLPHAVENYMVLDTLINAFRELQETNDG